MQEAISKFQAILSVEAGVDNAEVVVTRDTIDEFLAANGRRLRRDGTRPATPYECMGAYYQWDGVQPGGKGTQRGTLYVMDAGDVRLAYFQL